MARSFMVFFCALMLTLALLLRCSGGADVAGTGNSTGNGVVAGIVIHESGAPAESTEIKLLPVDFNPAKDTLHAAMRDTTDTNGAYALQGIPGTHYNIIALHLGERTRAFLDDIEAREESAPHADTLMLHRPGAAFVALDSLNVAAGDRIFIPGTDIYADIDAEALARGAIVIDSIPSGSLRGARLHHPVGPPETIGPDSLRVAPEDTVDIDIPVNRKNLPVQ